MKNLAIILAISLFCVGCSHINSKLGLSDDNFLEEIVEEIIESRTGLKLDLTPESAE